MRLRLAAPLAGIVVSAACGGAHGVNGGDAASRQLVFSPGAHAAAGAPAARRALVLANGAYANKDAQLLNPPRDAEAVEKALRDLGFASVDRKVDLDRRGMREAIDAFVDSLRADDAAVVYYAGHGLEINHKNYLIPIDFAAKKEAEADEDGYALDTLLGVLEKRVGPNVVIVDACRNNPFTRSWTRDAAAHGFAEVNPAEGTAVWFSTAGNSVAEDGPDGGNSPFATALLAQLRAGKTRLDDLNYAVKSDVLGATQHRQTPFLWNELLGPFCFAPSASCGSGSSRAGAGASSAPAGGARASRALLVGVSTVADAALKSRLTFATDRDVRVMGRTFTKLGYGDVRVLQDAGATLAGLRTALDALVAASAPGDRAAFYFAGGGNTVDVARGRQALFPYDTRAASGGVDAASVLGEEELATRLDALRKKLGPDGHLLVVLDAYRVFQRGASELDDLAGGVSDRAPMTLLEPPRDIAMEGAGGKDGEEAAGLLTRAFSTAATNVGASTSYHELLRTMRVGTPSLVPMVSLDGDDATQVGTGAPTPGRAFFETAPQLRYGSATVYLIGGRLHGLFAGTTVDLHAPSRYPPRAAALAHGTVVETGLRWARVELDAPARPPGTFWVLPATRAMPPVSVHVDVDASAVTAKDAMAKKLAAIAPSSRKDARVSLVLTEDGTYGYLAAAEGRRTIAGPFATRDPAYVDRISAAVWQLAFGAYLSEVTGDASVQSHASARVQRASGLATVTAEIHGDVHTHRRTRGFVIEREWMRVAALRVGAAGDIEDLGGGDDVQIACDDASLHQPVRLFGTSKWSGGMEDLDFARVRSSPAAPFAAGTAVVAASPEQPTRMELDPDTAARLKDLDMVAVFTMTPCEQAVDAAAASRDLQIDQ